MTTPAATAIPSMDIPTTNTLMPTSMLQMMDQLIKLQHTNLENALTKLADKLNVTPADPPPPARRTETIPVLPEFHPSRGSDPLQWINTIELCFDEDTKINSRALILTLSRSMKGSAASWFARQANSHLCWDDFKLAFVGEFAVLDTPATALNELFSTSPKGVLDREEGELSGEELISDIYIFCPFV
ncbi:hypothetical protein M8J77_009690 [Diaphorina citri]|nr:hypothetical protein M8J77_009690 [Diaphorina citri]